MITAFLDLRESFVNSAADIVDLRLMPALRNRWLALSAHGRSGS